MIAYTSDWVITNNRVPYIQLLAFASVVVCGWFAIGIYVASATDKDGSLYDWVKSCPYQTMGFVLVVLGWPVVLFGYACERFEKRFFSK